MTPRAPARTRTRALRRAVAVGAAVAVLGGVPAADADVLEVVSTGDVHIGRLGITERFRATAIAPDGGRRPLPEFVVGGSGEIAGVAASPDGTRVAVGFDGGHQGATILRTDGGGAPFPFLFRPLTTGGDATWTSDGRRLLLPLDRLDRVGSDEPSALPRRIGVCDVARGRCHVRRTAGRVAATLPDGRLVSATTSTELPDIPAADLGVYGAVPRGSREARRMRRDVRRTRVARVTVAGATTSTAWRRRARPSQGIDVVDGAVAGPSGVLLALARTTSRLRRRARCPAPGPERRTVPGCVFVDARYAAAAPLLVEPSGAVRELPRLRSAGPGPRDVRPVLGLPDGRWVGLTGQGPAFGSTRPASDAPLWLITASGGVLPVLLGGRPVTAATLAAAVGRKAADGTVDVLGHERSTGALVVQIAVGGGDEPTSPPRATVRLPLDGATPPTLVGVENDVAVGPDTPPQPSLLAAW